MIAVSASEAYDIWAETYDTELNPVLALETRELASILDRIQARKVLDVGCGTGRWLERFVARGCNVTGVDASPAMLARAQRKPAVATHLVAARATALPVAGESADLLFCSMSLGYFDELEAVFREFTRVVTKHGFVVISDLHPAAMKAGWTRSFRAGGIKYTIANWHHPLAAIFRAAERAGLVLESSSEFHFGTDEFPIFAAAGKAGAFEDLRSKPAIFAGVWRRRC